MAYIVEALTREGLICERFATYAEARRRVDSIAPEMLMGVPFIFRELADGSQRLVREDGKPLQWHRLEEDRSADFAAEPLPLLDELPDWPDGAPAIRPLEPRSGEDDVYDLSQ